MAKTVYVLGAGCSYHAGIPVARNFWDAAKATAAEAVPDLVGPLERLTNLLLELPKALDTDDDYVNVEEFFALLEVARECGIPAGENYESLLLVLSATIDHACQEAIHSGPDRVYTKFVDTLVSLNRNRGAFEDRYLPDQHFDLYTDTVINFNYDILLDHALTSYGMLPYYALHRIPTDESFFEFKNSHPFHILKPHGSLNWLLCAKHPGGDWAWAIPQDGQSIKLEGGKPNWAHLLWRSVHGRRDLACPKCGSPEHLKPVLLAPGYGKYAGDGPMKMVWNSMVHEMYRAEKIVIAGYSLPPTDFDFANMLRAATSKGSELKRADVVNLDDSSELKEKYRNLLCKVGIKDIKWNLGVSFQEYVENFMGG